MNEPTTKRPVDSGAGPHLTEDLCLDLLHDLLSAEDADRVCEHLAVCPACEELLRSFVIADEQRRATHAIEVQSNGTFALRDRFRGIETVSPLQAFLESLRALWRRPSYRLAAGLAVVTALLLIIAPWDRGDRHACRLHSLPVYFDETHARAIDTGGADGYLAAGLEAYAGQRYVRAITLLEQAEATEHFETIRKIYLGSALAWEGRHREAAAILDPLALHTLPDPWGAEAQWTLFVALKESRQEARADSLLEIMQALPGEIGLRAREAVQ